MKLSLVTIIIGSALIAMAIGSATMVKLSSDAAVKRQDEIISSAIDSLSANTDLAESVKQIQLDIIQVQQWLTDVSATRGLNGLDDGWGEADKYAKALPVDIAAARQAATQLAAQPVLDRLANVEAAFPSYYALGQKMAHAYVDAGTEAGNASMGDFDATAAKLSDAMGGLLTEVSALDARTRADAADRRVEVIATEQSNALAQQLSLALMVVGIAFITAFVAGYLLRRLKSISAKIRLIAEGDYSIDVHGSRLWEELKDIAFAAEQFKRSGKAVQELTASDAERQRRIEAERAQMMTALRQAFGEVVDEAVRGDFSRRVRTDFADRELNELAQSVNNLVTTVDRGLDETGTVLAALARTDLTLRVEGSYEGAFARLKDDTNNVADRLAGIVRDLQATSRSIRTASGEILAGANDLSERTTRQAATIEETSATMEQLSQTVSHNADKAVEASRRAEALSRTALASGDVMTNANQAMERIEQSSSKISNIIGLIDDIAFQTNLLALNASVEAARAGEAGKGFAVVAVEVRRLAQSAAEASNEVKALIETSAEEVRGGARHLDSATAQLSAMQVEARQTFELMQSIARESRDQAGAIAEVNTAVRQLDEMTQHNAALVEETNAAIEQTENQATQLDQLVALFRLDAARESPAQPGPARRGQEPGPRVLRHRQVGNTVAKEWAEF